jgi:hypothetical protein
MHREQVAGIAIVYNDKTIFESETNLILVRRIEWNFGDLFILLSTLNNVANH